MKGRVNDETVLISSIINSFSPLNVAFIYDDVIHAVARPTFVHVQLNYDKQKLTKSSLYCNTKYTFNFLTPLFNLSNIIYGAKVTVLSLRV